MSDSTLIWRDSADIKKGQISVLLSILVINLFIVLLSIAFILSGDLLALAMVILFIILDIPLLKNRKIQPLKIYNDKIIYFNINYGGVHNQEFSGPDIKKIQLNFSRIKKLGNIEFQKLPNRIKEIYGPDYKIKIFRIYDISGKEYNLSDQYITEFDTAYEKLKHQLEKYKKANP